MAASTESEASLSDAEIELLLKKWRKHSECDAKKNMLNKRR